MLIITVFCIHFYILPIHTYDGMIFLAPSNSTSKQYRLKFQIHLNDSIELNVDVHSHKIDQRIFYSADCFAATDVHRTFETELPVFSFSFWRNISSWAEIENFSVSSRLKSKKIDQMLITVKRFLKMDLVHGIRACEINLFE